MWYNAGSKAVAHVCGLMCADGGEFMQVYQIIMLSVYAVCVCAMVVMKFLNVGNRRRGVVKCISSALFLSMAVVGFVRDGGEFSVVALLGVIFAAAGDVFLVFMDKRCWFLCGVFSFALASLCLSTYCTLVFDWQWWFSIVFVVLLVALVIGQVTKVIDFGSCMVSLNIYTIFVALCGSLGLTLFVQGTGNYKAFLFGLGCFMYLVSDICLGLYLYKFRNRYIDSANTMLYFPGLMLIALAL